ncbi:hypothetical protein D3C83_264420 [compost metagenome]
MVVYAVAKPGIADLVDADEVIERIRSTVGHDEPMERDSEPSFTEALNWLRLSQDSCAGGNQDMPPIQ